MRLLLDEHMSPRLGELLSAEGHEVQFVAVKQPSSADEEILAAAAAADLVVVTRDRDFGFLVFGHGQAHAGVIYLRMRSRRPTTVLPRVLAAIEDLQLRPGRFLTVTESAIREGQP